MNTSTSVAFRKIWKGSIVIGIGVFFWLLLYSLRNIILARFLGPSGFGVFSLGETIFLIIASLSMLGFQNGVTHFVSISRNDVTKTKQIIKYVFRFIVFSSVIFGILLFLIKDFLANYFGMSNLALILTIFAITLPFYVLFEFVMRVFQGFSLMWYRTLLDNIFVNLTYILFFFILSLFFAYLFTASVSFLLSYFIFFVISMIFLLRKINFLKVKENIDINKKIFRYSWPLLFSIMIYRLLARLDLIMVGYFSGKEIVGIYSVAVFISTTLLFLNKLYLPIFFPTVSELITRRKTKEATEIFSKVTKFLVVFTLPLLLVYIVFSKEILYYVFGERYITAYSFLILLSIANFLATAAGPVDTFLNSMKRTKLVLVNNIVALFLNITLNIILILKMGPIGAAIATMVSLFVQNYLGVLEIFIITRSFPYSWKLLRPIVVVMVLGIVLIRLKSLFMVNVFSTVFLILGTLILYSIYLLIDRNLINWMYFLRLINTRYIKK